MEQNINGTVDMFYVYGAAIGVGSDSLLLDHFDSIGYYLHDLRDSVTGITNKEGQIYQSYRYSVFGEITFGASQYENEYTYNGESYNPNIKSQYLRARYYCVVTADFLTEDGYLGDTTEPLTLNRYNYCVGSPLNYVNPSGNMVISDWFGNILDSLTGSNNNKSKNTNTANSGTSALDYLAVRNIIALDSKFDSERDKFKAAFEDNEERYRELADKIGVTAELIAVIHYRENSKDYLEGSFGVYLHNGEKLGEITKKVPKGIYFDDFNEAAENAIEEKNRYVDLYHLTADSKDIVAMMCFAEVYNGLGYYNNGHISPYLYSGTNLYTSGKYVEERNSEGNYVVVYKEDVVDAQIGVYILLNAILYLEEEQ